MSRNLTSPDTTEDIQDGFRNDPVVAVNPAVAILVAIPISAYAFCGVEIVAVAALEAANPHVSLRWPPTRYIAPVLLTVYFISIFLFYLNISWRDPLLASLPKRNSSPSSIIMIAAMNAKIPILPGFLNSCLIMAIVSAANTALYVASRTLYGLTRGLRHNGSLLSRCLCPLGTTNGRGVPIWALIVSALVFGSWLPLLHSLSSFKDQALQDIMSGIASVAIVMVWAFQCIAFIRFRKWLAKHQRFVREEFPEFINSLPRTTIASGSWVSFFQPIGSWIGLLFCFLTVAVFSSTSWWDRGESAGSILAAWMGPGVLFLIWVLMKLKTKRWIIDLSEDNLILRKELVRLNNIGSGSGVRGISNPSSKESSRHNTFDTHPNTS